MMGGVVMHGRRGHPGPARRPRPPRRRLSRPGGAGRDGPGLAGGFGGAGGRQRGDLRSAAAGGAGPAPARRRAEPPRPRLALVEPPGLFRTLRVGRAMGPLQVPRVVGRGMGHILTGASSPSESTTLGAAPRGGGAGRGGQGPRTDTQVSPLPSSPAASGTPRSCSPTSRTATASQGTCWSASPQVRGQAGRWPWPPHRAMPVQPHPAHPPGLSPRLKCRANLCASCFNHKHRAPRLPAPGPGRFPTLSQGRGVPRTWHTVMPPSPPRCSPLPQRVTMHKPDPLSSSPSSHRLLHPRQP